MTDHKVEFYGTLTPEGTRRHTAITYRDLTEIIVDGKTVYLDGAKLVTQA